MAERTSHKTPIRMCVSCRETSEKQALLRIVRGSDGQAHVDPTGKAPGRGAYLCGAEECLKLAIKGKRLGKALRCEVSEELVRELEDRLSPAVAKDDRLGSDRSTAMGSGDKSYEC